MLFLLLLTCFASTCLQHSPNLVQRLFLGSEGIRGAQLQKRSFANDPSCNLARVNEINRRNQMQGDFHATSQSMSMSKQWDHVTLQSYGHSRPPYSLPFTTGSPFSHVSIQELLLPPFTVHSHESSWRHKHSNSTSASSSSSLHSTSSVHCNQERSSHLGRARHHCWPRQSRFNWILTPAQSATALTFPHAQWWVLSPLL